jgi:hypothetical protein
MVTQDPSGPGSHGFSPELAREVATALSDYLLSNDVDAEVKLRVLTNRVCAEAHALGLPPEKMLIAIKQLFERAPVSHAIHMDTRRRAFERFLSGCIKTYFETDQPLT